MLASSITVSVRSRGGKEPRLRLERSVRIPAGTFTVALVAGEVVVTAGATSAEGQTFAAPYDGPTLPGEGSSAPATLMLRQGPLELLVYGMPSGLLPHAESRPAEPGDAGEAPDVGDAPTRMLSVSDALRNMPPPGPAAKDASRPQRRRIVALTALLALLLASALVTLAWPRHRQTPDAVRSGVAFASAASDGSEAQAAPSTTARPAPPARPATPAPDATIAPDHALRASPRPGGGSAEGVKSKARRAADALASGAYGEALPLYEALASEPNANEAYAQIARTLRSWSSTVSGSTGRGASERALR
jgi:hypothetical protein